MLASLAISAIAVFLWPSSVRCTLTSEQLELNFTMRTQASFLAMTAKMHSLGGYIHTKVGGRNACACITVMIPN